MTSQATSARKPSSSEILLTVVNGPEAGVAYKLLGQSVSLGRDPQNDIILQDNKSSRNHAVIERRGSQYWVRDLQSKSGLLVNGQRVEESPLQLGDQIVLGETQLRFGTAQAPLSLVNSSEMPPVAPPPVPNRPLVTPSNATASSMPGWLPPLPGQSRYKGNPKQNPVKLILIIAVIIGLVIVIGKKSDSRKYLNIKDPNEVDDELNNIGQSNEKREQEILKKGKDTQQYYEAQGYFLRGFREYREGNYLRATQNFQAALALYPTHILAKKYLERSRVKNDELVTSALERAEKAFELQKFNVAYNEYRTVILLAGDAKSEKVRLAKKRMEAIELIFANSK